MQTKAVTKVNDPGQIHKYSHIILDEARWLSVANAEATEAHTHTTHTHKCREIISYRLMQNQKNTSTSENPHSQRLVTCYYVVTVVHP